MKRFSNEELAAMAHALVLLAGLEPGDVVLEENDDGTISGYLFGSKRVTGPLHLAIEELGQALWQFTQDQAPAFEPTKVGLKR